MMKVEKRVSFVELRGHDIGLIGMNGRAEIVLLHLTFIEMIDFHAGIPIMRARNYERQFLYAISNSNKWKSPKNAF